MTEEQKKIQQIEDELEKLSSQLNYYRQQISQLKEKNHLQADIKKTQEEIYTPSQRDNNWEFPSHKPESSLSLENFIGLKLLHLTGIVVLVVGISIGVKYAVDKELISPVTRIILAYMAGVILYLLSVRLKRKFILFSAI